MNATVVSLQDARPRGQWAIESALAESDLPAPARLVLYDLLRRSDASTAVIPERFSPSIAAIARTTGLSQTSVKHHLNIAEKAGWVTRTRRPKAVGDHDPTIYAIHTPLGGPGGDQGVGREATTGWSGGDLGVGREATPTRPVPDQGTPLPPASGGPAASPRCKTHTTPAPNCRGCGTNPRGPQPPPPPSEASRLHSARPVAEAVASARPGADRPCDPAAVSATVARIRARLHHRGPQEPQEPQETSGVPDTPGTEGKPASGHYTAAQQHQEGLAS